jgi:hypothetical protein
VVIVKRIKKFLLAVLVFAGLVEGGTNPWAIPAS